MFLKKSCFMLFEISPFLCISNLSLKYLQIGNCDRNNQTIKREEKPSVGGFVCFHHLDKNKKKYLKQVNKFTLYNIFYSFP